MIKKTSIILVLVLISIIGLYIFPFKSEKNKQNPVNVSQEELSNILKIKKPPNNKGTENKNITFPIIENTSQNNGTHETGLSNDFQSVHKMLSLQKYSNDPLIEFLSLITEIKSCENSKSSLRYIDDKEIRARLELTFEKQCYGVENTKKLLLKFKNKKKVTLLLSSEPMQSKTTRKFAALIKQKNEKEGLEFLFNLAIKSKSAPLIIMQTEKMNTEPYYLAISNKLATQNQGYIKLIGKQALQMFSCQYQQGTTCTNISPFMLNHCKKDQSLCGKDNNYWFNHYISKAHKADIEIILNWLNQQT